MTKIDIVNLSLAKLGASLISRLGDDSLPASHFGDLLYQPTLERVLRDFPWSLATKESTLALLPVKETTNWDYTYALPRDCVRVLELVSGNENIPNEMFSKTGNRLHADIEDVVLKYVSSDVDPVIFDPDFREALVTILAAELANPIIQDPLKAQALMQEYTSISLPKAKAVDARETGSRENNGTFRSISQSPTVRARFLRAGDRFLGQ